jgi:inactivated superfamily I helicase
VLSGFKMTVQGGIELESLLGRLGDLMSLVCRGIEATHTANFEVGASLEAVAKHVMESEARTVRELREAGLAAATEAQRREREKSQSAIDALRRERDAAVKAAEELRGFLAEEKKQAAEVRRKREHAEKLLRETEEELKSECLAEEEPADDPPAQE